MKKTTLYLLISLIFISCDRTEIKTSPSDLSNILKIFHDPSSTNVLIAAHRALHTKFPENSLAAFQHSIDSGVDIIEADIRTTKDGKLILMHDATIDRTTTGEGRVEDLTYAELLKLELKKESGDSTRHIIPLAEDAFRLAHGKIMIDIDIKGVSAKALVDLVHRTKTEKQAIFFDSELAVLDSIILLDSTLLLMPRAYSLEEVKMIIDRFHPPVIHIDPSFYTEEVVSTIKRSGAKVWINALGVADAAAKIGLVDSAFSPLVEGGANIIQTDYPIILHQFLAVKNLR